MSSVLVTGGAGYIGSHVCKWLREDGFAPLVLDNLSTGNQQNVRWGPLIKGDIGDVALLRSIRDDHEIIGVVHAAALLDVAESVRHPEQYRTVNVLGTVALNSVFDVPMVFSSSAAVYGNVNQMVTEDQELDPESPYGATKAECERLLSNAMRLRYFNVSGADAEIPFRRSGTHLIANLLRCARSDEVFEVQGDGSAVRDFVDVRDVAMANVLALKSLLEGAKGRPVNVCTGLGHSVRDVVSAVSSAAGRPIELRVGDRRAGDVDRMVGDNTLAAALLGWKPRFTLEDQIAAAWRSTEG